MPMTNKAVQHLGQLQRQLEAIYGVVAPHAVEDFLITDAELARQLDNSEQARESEEKLLVRETDDSLDLALYLDPDLIARLASDDPHQCLHDGNVSDFCTVLEGVSHFLYLTWNAAKHRSVTCLEMEMQAEVDKYITVHLLADSQANRRIRSRLHRWLFEEARFDSALSDDELVRYRDANRYAGKFCFQLEQRYFHATRGNRGDWLDELRDFYRLGLRDKIRRIDYAQ